jgi:type IX secretion system PorP/SprF family membrane protein
MVWGLLKYYLFFVLLFSLISKIHPQQIPSYSQYTFNTFLINPAVAGSDGYTSINLTSRLQWVGIKGAPVNNSVSIQARIFKRDFIQKSKSAKKKYVAPKRSGRVGLGAYAFIDKAGPLNYSGVRFCYAYHIKMYKSKISYGLAMGLYQLKIDKNYLILENMDDKLINSSNLYQIAPDINAGFYYTRKSLFLGFSVENLLQNQLNFATYNGNYKAIRQYNLISGYWIDAFKHLALEPSIYLKLRQHMATQFDISLKATLFDFFWMGVNHKTGKICSLFTGIKLDRFHFGYAYDLYGNFIESANYPTHELMLTLKLGDNTRRYRWIERY